MLWYWYISAQITLFLSSSPSSVKSLRGITLSHPTPPHPTPSPPRKLHERYHTQRHHTPPLPPHASYMNVITPHPTPPHPTPPHPTPSPPRGTPSP